MSNPIELTLSLYKANLELQLKLARLVQENSRQWLDFSYRLVNDGIAESNAGVEQLLKTEDWQKLSTLPAESFWRQLQQRFGDTQAAAQIAVSAQTTFASGLQDAVRNWQKETTTTLSSIAPAAPLNGTGWTELFKPWEQFVSAGLNSSAPVSKTKSAAKGAE
jgi:hypothetical protein